MLVRGGEVGIAFGHVCSIGEVGAWLAPDERFVSRMGAPNANEVRVGLGVDWV